MMGFGNFGGLRLGRHDRERRQQKARAAGTADKLTKPAEQDFLRRQRHWLIPVACVLLLGLFAIPVWMLVSNIRDSDGAESLPNDTGLGAPKYNYFGKAVEVYSTQDDGFPTDLCVTFEFLGLNEATSQASFGILVEATRAGNQRLKSWLSLQNHPPRTGTLKITSTSGVSNISIPFSLSALEDAQPVSCDSAAPDAVQLDVNAGVRVTQSIFMLGTQRAFPNDWYELDDTVNVSVPGIALHSSLIMTSRDENFSLRASVYNSRAQQNAGSDGLEFTIRRSWQFWTYTYIVASMPFVLLIGVFVIKYSRRREEVPEPYEVAFGVAATLVAILPLRSVLVPASLPSPTRLDIFFGLGTIFLVVGSIIWVLVRTERNLDAAARGHPSDSAGQSGVSSESWPSPESNGQASAPEL